MFKLLIIASMLSFLSCAPSSGGGNTPIPTAAAGTCAEMPATATVNGSSCVSASGEWTSYTYDSSTNQYNMFCGGGDTEHYSSQADFNSNEGTSGASGITIVSNQDYVNNPTCASGSILYDDGSGVKTFLFVWKKSP
jgi:hypothetical protein